MSTIVRVPRQSGFAYKALIRLKGVKPFSKTFLLRKDAKTWAERMERDIDTARAHGNAVVRQMTLSDLIKKYVAQPGLDKATITNLNWWRREYGDHKIIDIDRSTIREGLASLKAGLAHRGNGRGKSTATNRKRAPATVNRYQSALSAAFEFGREHYDLPDNPCREVKGQPENNGRVRFLSDKEREVLLAACKDSKWDHLYLLVLMAITTGARLGELLRLRWKDIQFPERRGYVPHTKNGEPRVLPLVPNVTKILQKLTRPLDGDVLIFCSASDPKNPFEFRKHWNKAIQSSGIENFRFHDLRHTCASYLAQNGATLIQIADVLGHKQLEVTKRYSHLCADHKQTLIDRVLGNL